MTEIFQERHSCWRWNSWFPKHYTWYQYYRYLEGRMVSVSTYSSRTIEEIERAK